MDLISIFFHAGARSCGAVYPGAASIQNTLKNIRKTIDFWNWIAYNKDKIKEMKKERKGNENDDLFNYYNY